MASSAAKMISAWRIQTGCSQAELARRAGVPASTVRRIETGETDPTLTMLQRISAAAGMHLDVTAVPISSVGPSLADLATRAGRQDGTVDWTQIRAFADWCEQNSDRVPEAIQTPPTRSGSDRLDNLIAAFAERVADMRCVPRPSWTRSVRPLSVGWYLDQGTPRMRERSAAAAPPQFRERNIHIAEDCVWRDRHDVADAV